MLLARIHEVLPLLCLACGGPMRVLAFLTDSPVVAAILLDQTPAFDPAQAEPVPDVVFDKSLPDDFEN